MACFRLFPRSGRLNAPGITPSDRLNLEHRYNVAYNVSTHNTTTPPCTVRISQEGFLRSTRTIFSRLTIRAKLLIAFVGLSVLPVVCVSFYGIYINVRTTENIAFENLTHDVTTTRGRASNFLINVEGDIRLLLNSTGLKAYLRTAGLARGTARDPHLRQLSEEFLAFARTRGIYYQIRLIDNDREEALRIESDDILDSVSHFSIVPPATLRRSGQIYYFLLTDNLRSGDIVFSPVVDTKEYPEGVDVALVEGAVCNDEHLTMIRRVRARTRMSSGRSISRCTRRDTSRSCGATSRPKAASRRSPA